MQNGRPAGTPRSPATMVTRNRCPRVLSRTGSPKSPLRTRYLRPVPSRLVSRRATSRKERRTQPTPYRRGATALTDRLTRNSSWSTARRIGRGVERAREGGVTRARRLSHTASRSPPSPTVRAFALSRFHAFALRHHLVVVRRTAARGRARIRQFTTPCSRWTKGCRVG